MSQGRVALVVLVLEVSFALSSAMPNLPGAPPAYNGSHVAMRPGYINQGKLQESLGSHSNIGGGGPLGAGNKMLCPALPALTNGKRSTTARTWDTLVVSSCNTGYRLASGDTNRRCGDDKKWTGKDIICQITSCPVLPTLSNGVRSSTARTYGTTVTSSCNAGYKVASGDAKRTCQADQKWSGTDITCQVTSCPVLPTLSNGVRSSTARTYGTAVTSSCNAGYKVASGDAKRTCQADQKWSGTDITCQVTSCPVLPTLSNGVRSSTARTYGTTVTSSCNAGYKVASGDAKRTCQAGQNWSGKDIICQKTGCPSVPTQKNAISKNTETAVGAKATYTCIKGYTKLAGQDAKTCQSSLTWSSDEIVCAAEVAYRMPTDQPTTSSGGYSYRAVDGNVNGQWVGASCTHTGYLTKPWWAVDLQQTYQIEYVSLTNRQDCCADRLSKVSISVTNTKPTGASYDPVKSTTCVTHAATVPTGKPYLLKCTQLISGQYVVVSRDQLVGNHPFTVCEVKVYTRDKVDFYREWNLALRMPSYQRTTGHEGVPYRANDGNTSPAWGGASCTSTGDYSTGYPWWAVDLLGSYTITHVELTNRQDCCDDRISVFTIAVTATKPTTAYVPNAANVCFSRTEKMQYAETTTFKCTKTLSGRYLVIARNNRQYNAKYYQPMTTPFTLCEVKVFTTTQFGSLAWDAKKGRNVAYGKSAFQSSTLYGYVASRAVDGRADPRWGWGTCTATARQANPWWAVDLAKVYTVQYISLVNRGDCCPERLSKLKILVTNTKPSGKFVPSSSHPDLCAEHPAKLRQGEDKTLECQPTKDGRYVVVSSGIVDIMTVCEVRVYPKA